MSGDITTIQVTEDTWRELNRRKGPGDTFDDVIQELLAEVRESQGDGGEA